MTLYDSRSQKLLSQSGFSFVELIVVVTILAILSVIGVTYGNNYKLSQYNVRRMDDIKTLQNAAESYMEAKKSLPPALGNRQYYDTKGNYVHDPDTAFAVSSFVTPDTFPREYLQTFPLDPQTNHYYAYGSRLDGNLHFEFATVINDGGEYSTYLRGNYTGTPLISLIKEYNGPNFVDDGTVDYLPYNPEELKVTGHIISWSGTLSLNTHVLTDTKQILGQGDVLKVSAGGLAKISLSDGSELELGSLSSDSELRFDTLKYKDDNNLSTQVESFLTMGEVWVRAPKYYEKSEFSIKTDGQTATVRGTVFGVTNDGNGKRNFQLADGKILVTNMSGGTLHVDGDGYAYDASSSGTIMSVWEWSGWLDLSLIRQPGCTPPPVSYGPTHSDTSGLVPSAYAGDTITLYNASTSMSVTPVPTEHWIDFSFSDSQHDTGQGYNIIRSKQHIQSSVDPLSPDVSIATIPANTYSYSDTSAESGTTYNYRICRIPVTNIGWYCSTEVTLTTLGTPPTPPVGPCEDTLSGTTASGTLQEKMDAVTTEDIGVHSGRIPEILELTKTGAVAGNTSNKLIMKIANFSANEIEVSASGTTFTGSADSASSIVTFTWSDAILTAPDTTLSIRLCYDPAKDHLIGERRCSGEKTLTLPAATDSFSFADTTLARAKDETSTCATGFVSWWALGCQPDTLLASAEYNAIDDTTGDPAALGLVTRGSKIVPATTLVYDKRSDFTCQSNCNLPYLPMPLNGQLWTTIGWLTFLDGTSDANKNCNASAVDPGSTAWECMGSYLDTDVVHSRASKYTDAGIQINPKNNIWKFPDGTTGVYIDNYATTTTSQQPDPKSQDHMKYDLSSIADKLGDHFAIEIGVRGAALLRPVGNYSLWFSSDTSFKWGLQNWTIRISGVSPIPVTSISHLDQYNKYTVRFQKNWTRYLFTIPEINYSTWWVLSSTYGYFNGIDIGHSIWGSPIGPVNQWNDIITSFRIYSLK